MSWGDYLIIYLCIGMIIAIPLARKYWLDFRRSDDKRNIIHPLKIVNRIVDSYVFMIAWVIYTPFYPIYLIENGIKKLMKKEK